MDWKTIYCNGNFNVMHCPVEAIVEMNDEIYDPEDDPFKNDDAGLQAENDEAVLWSI